MTWLQDRPWALQEWYSPSDVGRRQPALGRMNGLQRTDAVGSLGRWLRWEGETPSLTSKGKQSRPRQAWVTYAVGFGELKCLGIWVISKGKVLGGRERMKVQEVNTDPDGHRGDPNRAGIGLGLIPKRLADMPQVGAGSSHLRTAVFLEHQGPWLQRRCWVLGNTLQFWV